MLINRMHMGPLRAPAGTAGAGGGGESNATPTMEAILAEITKVVDAKVTGQFQKFREENDAKFAPITSSLSGITEALGKLSQNPNPNPNPNPAGGGTRMSPEENVLLKNLQDVTKKQQDSIERLTREKQESDQKAERSDRHSTIKGALNNMHFINDVAAQTAFTIVEPHIKRQDDGGLIGGVQGGDLYPVDAFVKDYLMKEHSYLLRASGNSGSGAPANPGVRMGAKADLNDIKVGMKPETRESIIASIGAALANT